MNSVRILYKEVAITAEAASVATTERDAATIPQQTAEQQKEKAANKRASTEEQASDTCSDPGEPEPVHKKPDERWQPIRMNSGRILYKEVPIIAEAASVATTERHAATIPQHTAEQPKEKAASNRDSTEEQASDTLSDPDEPEPVHKKPKLDLPEEPNGPRGSTGIRRERRHDEAMWKSSRASKRNHHRYN